MIRAVAVERGIGGSGIRPAGGCGSNNLRRTGSGAEGLRD